jgi:hypothetical protein
MAEVFCRGPGCRRAAGADEPDQKFVRAHQADRRPGRDHRPTGPWDQPWAMFAVRAALTSVLLVHTEEVTGSIPVSPTQVSRPVPIVAAAVQAALQAGKPSRPPRRGPRVPAADLRAAVLRWHRLYAARLQLPDNRETDGATVAASVQVASRHGGRSCPRTEVIT